VIKTLAASPVEVDLGSVITQRGVWRHFLVCCIAGSCLPIVIDACSSSKLPNKLAAA
jgi:hypothetical protein